MKKIIMGICFIVLILILNSFLYLNASYAATAGQKQVITKTLPVTGM